jgi:hypothetical protein
MNSNPRRYLIGRNRQAELLVSPKSDVSAIEVEAFDEQGNCETTYISMSKLNEE